MLYLATALGLAMAPPHGRTLSYTGILNYQPGSQVTDHANIDLDQAALERAMGSLPAGFTTAKAIYETGAHSKPTGTCTLISPTTLGQAVARRAAVVFTSNNGDSVSGSAYSAYEATATSISFTYPVSDQRVQPASSACYVGSMPDADKSVLGCIAGSSDAVPTTGSGPSDASFTIAGTTYTASCTNRGRRTLKGFSTGAQSKMYECPVDSTVAYANGCPYTSYLPYYTYYGQYDYANQIVTAALDGTIISGFTNGGFTFVGTENVQRKEYTKKGTAYMNAWMYVIREFEDAIDDCVAGDLTSNAASSGPVHAWDEGVAFYAGSMMTYDDLLAGELPTLDDKGKLAYTLANKRCQNYKTCGPDGNSRIGEAKANIDLFDLFRMGQYQLLAGECALVVPIKDQIVSKMLVPLVQGTLRYAYKVAALSGGPKEKAEGGIFAAAVLPMVHRCDPDAAATIFTSMNLQSTAVDYPAVKAAFEGCYASMGITCADVGGLWNSATSGYYLTGTDDASPCVDAATATGDSNATIFLIVAIAVFCVCALCVLFMICKERSGKPIFNALEPKKGGASA